MIQSVNLQKRTFTTFYHYTCDINCLVLYLCPGDTFNHPPKSIDRIKHRGQEKLFTLILVIFAFFSNSPVFPCSKSNNHRVLIHH